jgi:hypothetical protein
MVMSNMFEAETLMGILRDWPIISKDELLGSVEKMGDGGASYSNPNSVILRWDGGCLL